MWVYANPAVPTAHLWVEELLENSTVQQYQAASPGANCGRPGAAQPQSPARALPHLPCNVICPFADVEDDQEPFSPLSICGSV